MFIGKVGSISSFIGKQLQCSDQHFSLKEQNSLLRDQAMFNFLLVIGRRIFPIFWHKNVSNTR